MKMQRGTMSFLVLFSFLTASTAIGQPSVPEVMPQQEVTGDLFVQWSGGSDITEVFVFTEATGWTSFVLKQKAYGGAKSMVIGGLENAIYHCAARAWYRDSQGNWQHTALSPRVFHEVNGDSLVPSIPQISQQEAPDIELTVSWSHGGQITELFVFTEESGWDSFVTKEKNYGGNTHTIFGLPPARYFVAARAWYRNENGDWESTNFGPRVPHDVIEQQYAVQEVEIEGNREFRLIFDDFHWGSVIITDVGNSDRLVFRPHPDQSEPDGWGSSIFWAPFVSGADSGNTQAYDVVVQPNGIKVSASGFVNAPGGGVFGTWTFTIELSYDPVFESITSANGELAIQLDDELSVTTRDLVLYRLSSNFLHHVPLQSGGVGDTGDIKEVVVEYAPDGDSSNFIWYPPSLPSHYPWDFTSYLRCDAVGAYNDVDTLAMGEPFQINPALKPSLAITLIANEPNYQMIAGMEWDEMQNNFAADNIGLGALVVQGTTNATSMSFEVEIQSTPPQE